MGRIGIIALAFLGLLLLRADAQPGRRVALVIGNGSYEDAGALANPVNDAIDVAAKLRELGFEVIEGNDLGKRDLERKIGDFSDALDGAVAGLFYYAGHGVQVDGRNFIVPVDARLDMPTKLTLEAVPIDQVLDIMESQTEVSLVFLDACRNNPFARGLGTTTRSARPLQGLAQFDSSRGSFIAFSTAPGAVAMDGAGRNSPFAAALVRHMGKAGESIADLMIAVRRDVISETRGLQRPFEQGSLTERFEFAPSGEPAIARQPAAPPADVQVSALERSVGDSRASIETMLRNDYLAPDPDRLDATIRRLYTDKATIFGTPYGIDAIVAMKRDWFGQYASWTLALEPGSLRIEPLGEDGADVSFAMSYEYIPKSDTVARSTGKAQISLELERIDSSWRIKSETAAAMN